MMIYVWAAVGIVRERFWLLPVALIGVVRPEGMILLVAILIAIFIVKRDKIPVYLLFVALLPSVIWLLIRMDTYGVPFPNTYYAKATGKIAGRFFMGTVYSTPIILLLLVSWVAWFKNRNTDNMIVLGMVTMLWGLVWLGGGDFMHHFRLLVPLLGLLLAVAAAQYAGMAIWLRLVTGVTLLPLIFLIVHPSLILLALQGEQFNPKGYQEGFMTHQSIVMAEEIKKRYSAGKLIAVNHAGALPWALPEHNIIDMVGLNDSHIAHLKGGKGLHKKWDPEYVLSQKPDLIVLNTHDKPDSNGVWYDKKYWPGETAIVEHPLFENYRPTDMVYSWEWKMAYPYTLHPYTREKKTRYILLYERKN